MSDRSPETRETASTIADARLVGRETPAIESDEMGTEVISIHGDDAETASICVC